MATTCTSDHLKAMAWITGIATTILVLAVSVASWSITRELDRFASSLDKSVEQRISADDELARRIDSLIVAIAAE